MPKGIPNKFYTGEFKKKVIETMHNEKLSYRETARRNNIPDHKMVTNWNDIIYRKVWKDYTFNIEVEQSRSEMHRYLNRLNWI